MVDTREIHERNGFLEGHGVGVGAVIQRLEELAVEFDADQEGYGDAIREAVGVLKATSFLPRKKE